MNKNTKLIKLGLRKAVKRGDTEFSYQRPARGFHNNPQMETVTIPCLNKNKNGVVSTNESRNTQMKIYDNIVGGKKSSVTLHEALNPKNPVSFKNKNYIKTYRQPEGLR